MLHNTRMRLFPGKLISRWSGSFMIIRVFGDGYLELVNNGGKTFKVNEHLVKAYHEGMLCNKIDDSKLIDAT